MRIISGQHRGKKITAPKKLPVRPTTDRAKEALFNILGSRLDFTKLKVLDLFTGTGNISYEFASRGVPEITAVDAHLACVKFVKKTASELGMEGLKAIHYDVFKFLPKCWLRFNLIFADPPYDLKNVEELPTLVFEQQLLEEDGTLIIEHSEHSDLSHLPHFSHRRDYGHVSFSFFE